MEKFSDMKEKFSDFIKYCGNNSIDPAQYVAIFLWSIFSTVELGPKNEDTIIKTIVCNMNEDDIYKFREVLSKLPGDRDAIISEEFLKELREYLSENE